MQFFDPMGSKFDWADVKGLNELIKSRDFRTQGSNWSNLYLDSRIQKITSIRAQISSFAGRVMALLVFLN